MDSWLKGHILEVTNCVSVQIVEEVQSLWSGYGRIVRLELTGGEHESLILKEIQTIPTKQHPRGWNTDTSHQRKLKSYEVETHWYQNYSSECSNSFRIPKLIWSGANSGMCYLLMEDLNSAGFPLRKDLLSKDEVFHCLSWLANFHGHFLGKEPDGLWPIGTYWHLATRQDEYRVMSDHPLKNHAEEIDKRLNDCEFRTLVHGDAKVANFCFAPSGEVAAVDFQYVGGGCGMKDVAYFLGSCLSESACEQWEEELLDFYFNALRNADGVGDKVNFSRLEREWREMYPLAWADFNRFLLGWMPEHRKLNTYSSKMTQRALQYLT